MCTRSLPLLLLSEMVDDQQADLFVLMTAKESLATRAGKPYFKVAFRDAGREVSFPIWEDSPLTEACREQWQPGVFYKVRARYAETQYGPQLDIQKIREVTPEDAFDGFDPTMCLAQSRFDPDEMMSELLDIVQQHVEDEALQRLVVDILSEYREPFMSYPAAQFNHHAYRSGLLEHVLSVTKSSLMLADKYDEYYPDLQPRLNKDVAIAGAILHDIGKLREYNLQPQGAVYSAAGNLIGHILQGRDMVRESALAAEVAPDLLLRLEHVIVSHQRLPEWGSPKQPMTPEAMIVHYADDLDAKYQMMAAALRDDTGDGLMTSNRNPLRQRLYRGSDIE